MTRRPRQNHPRLSRQKVALAAVKGELALVELPCKLDVHTNQIKQGKDQLFERATGVFGDENKRNR
ncbi:transposase [Brucella sp. NF 2653]|nr:hypothetical protein [Brucella sp. 83/13]EFM61749.1 transposase [Brucella sp. NF 2653]